MVCHDSIVIRICYIWENEVSSTLRPYGLVEFSRWEFSNETRFSRTRRVRDNYGDDRGDEDDRRERWGRAIKPTGLVLRLWRNEKYRVRHFAE